MLLTLRARAFLPRALPASLERRSSRWALSQGSRDDPRLLGRRFSATDRAEGRAGGALRVEEAPRVADRPLVAQHRREPGVPSGTGAASSTSTATRTITWASAAARRSGPRTLAH